MGGFKNFLLRMQSGGNSMRGEQIENAIRLVQQTFADDPSYIVDGVTVYHTDRLIHPRIYLHKYRATSPAQANIQTQIHEPFYVGDVIPWPDHGYWLCIESNNLHGIQWEGTLQFCNYSVNFRSPLNGEIIKYPISAINATQYGSGETYHYDDELKMVVGTSQMIIYIPFDEHTIKIDSGFRFLIDRNTENPTVFMVAQADTISYSDNGNHGYIALTVYEDQFNPLTDNKELMVADYTRNPIADHDDIADSNDVWI